MKLKNILFENVDEIYAALNNAIPDETNVNNFATALGKFIKNEYGTHNIKPFMDTLHASLGLNEAENHKPAIDISVTFPGNRLYSITFDGEKQRGDDHDKAVEMIKGLTGIEMSHRESFNVDQVVDILKSKGYEASASEMDIT